jgi:hypothetical protein
VSSISLSAGAASIHEQQIEVEIEQVCGWCLAADLLPPAGSVSSQ